MVNSPQLKNRKMQNRVNCDNCQQFTPAILKDENDMFSGVKVHATCKLGKRVMFRKPIYKSRTSFIILNESGYIRFCNQFKNN